MQPRLWASKTAMLRTKIACWRAKLPASAVWQHMTKVHQARKLMKLWQKWKDLDSCHLERKGHDPLTIDIVPERNSCAMLYSLLAMLMIMPLP